jgi:DNA-binding CsgD family transcriptional regulator/protein-L-isoaspartate O-methyltransferase
MTFPDFSPAPNQGARPDLHELENRAMDPDGLVLGAMRDLAPWAGKTLVDLGCGSGFWLPGYADQAGQVIGVEPDPALLALAAARDPRARALAGSAEHIHLPDASVDVAHARFAYFWPPDCEAGLTEVLRVLKPGGTLVVVDNDQRAGEFAGLLRAAGGTAQGQADVTDAWWAARGAIRAEVMTSVGGAAGIRCPTFDGYSDRRWPQGIEHHLMLALPEPPGPAAGPGRYVRLVWHRGPGPDFSERDRALLVLLRPHLHQAYLDAERRRHPVPRLTPRQNDLLRLLAAGHTNTQIARRLGISEGTVRSHLENIYERLGVSSRTAAVTRAFPDRVV